MTIARRIAAAAVVAAAVSFACAALGFRTVLHHEMAAWGVPMGSGPSVSRLYGLLDLVLSASCGIAVFLAVLLGIWFGRAVGGRVSEIDRGLADFAAGKLERPIDDHGSDEMHRIAHSANEMARRISENLDAERELVAGLAHDIAHPLTALRNSLEAARDGLAAGVEPAAADRLLRSVSDVEGTLSDLRDVAASEAGFIRLDWTVSDISNIAQGAIEQYRDVAARRGVQLYGEFGDAAFAKIDQRRLGRVIANLIVNALAATSPGGYVRLSTALETDQAVLSIADSAGPEASESLRAALQEGVHGGLGLRVVRSLAAAMDAQIDVAQTVDGSSVQLRLVRVPASESGRALVSSSHRGTETNGTSPGTQIRRAL